MCPPSCCPDHDPATWCSHHSWYPIFRSHTLRTEIIELTTEFIEFLAEDGVFLGVASSALPTRGKADEYALMDEDGYKDWSSDDDTPHQLQAASRRLSHCSASSSNGSNSSTHTDRRPWTERFPDLHSCMVASIDRLGVAGVVPKLNWSCPTDATWVNPSTTLACGNAEQVVLMLKSSDRIAFDLEILQQRRQTAAASPQPQPLQASGDVIPSLPPPPQQQQESLAIGPSPLPQPLQQASLTVGLPLPAILVLRKWSNLLPEREFRCFVRSGALAGACQRDVSQHFPQLAAAAVAGRTGGPLQDIKRAIAAFHQDHVLASAFPLRQYTYDVYVTSSLAVKVLDFNPIGGATSPLLFSWPELGYNLDPNFSNSNIVADGGGVDTASVSSSHAAAFGNGANNEHAEAANESSSSGDSDASLSDDGAAGSAPEEGSPQGPGEAGRVGAAPTWPLRVVARGGGMQAGQRAACGMPFDMLSLQDGAAAGVFEMMQRERVGRGRA